ncbi:helix-turn-helix domain-containing protein [Candidatus Vondammii sp. HM_W22]|uniref:helix-turn-helix domain-containing protein n=1 Tax=Candidatus Vondammii sp. HM_W22 TaxID=2687299 RepID=UPI001F139FAD|nr:helix-turn-helix transcriptional regulator [Candidatus Vondammii sp. HM_W22]
MGIKNEKTAFSNRLNAVFDWNGFAEKNQGRQTKLAAMFKTSQQGARKWLEDEAIPRLENIRLIAQEFDVHMEWLHYGNGPISNYHYEVGQRIHKAREVKSWTEGDLASAL